MKFANFINEWGRAPDKIPGDVKTFWKLVWEIFKGREFRLRDDVRLIFIDKNGKEEDRLTTDWEATYKGLVYQYKNYEVDYYYNFKYVDSKKRCLEVVFKPGLSSH